MKNDETHFSAESGPNEAELEARIVAWVAGEASPFEVAELERLCAEKPELAIFKRRIEAVHGLVGEAVRPEKEPLRMAAERREKLLATIRAGSTASDKSGESGGKNAPVVLPLLAAKKLRGAKQWWLLGAAACGAMLAYLVVEMTPDFGVRKELAAVRSEQAVADEQRQRVVEAAKREAVAGAIAAQKRRSSEDNAARRKAEAEARAVGQVREIVQDDLGGDSAERKVLSSADRLEQQRQTIMLPRFEVKEDQAAGYGGGSSLAGSRYTASGTVSGYRIASPPADLQGVVDTALSSKQRLAATSNLAVSAAPQTSRGIELGISSGTQQLLKDTGATGPSVVLRANYETAGVGTKGNSADGAGAQGPMLEVPRFGRPAGEMNLSLHAPSPPPPGAPLNEESVVTLSPFDVSGESETGYAAATTLAGNRLNTELRDVGSAIRVVTSEFLKDTGAVDNSTLLQYMTGTEVAGVAGNFVGAGNKIAARYEADAPAMSPPAADTFAVGGPGGTSFADAVVLPPTPLLGAINQEQVLSQSALEVAVASQNVTTVPAAMEKEIAERVDAELDAKKKAEDAERAKNAAPVVPSVDETSAARESVSTFSLHVSDVSFQLAKAALARGEMPEPARIRPEEFYNAFDYGDPAPGAGEKVGARIEQAAHPFLQQRNLVRIALKVAATGRGAGQPLRLTVLLDTSGSMEREDRAATVRAAMASLLSLLGPNDRISVIGFARQPRLIADGLAGDQTGALWDAIARTPSEGGTNLEEALKAARESAEKHFDAAAQNRIVLLTDGAANLGDADPARLSATIEALRQAGVAFDACGVGLNGLDDAMLEALTRKGNGRYAVLDSAADADAGFARQLAGAFRPAAENVKVQVRFNPARVGRYRLIGFEQHRLREEDFRNDQVDAAELAAEEGAVALYQVEVLPQGEGELGEVFVRFRDPATGAMVERSWTMAHDARAPAFDRATPTLQLAGVSALVAEKLRGSALADQFKLGDFAGVVNALRGHFESNERVQELVAMIGELRRQRGE